MAGGRCHRRKKMMGMGALGGCGTEERPCPVSRVAVKIPAIIPEVSNKEVSSASVDFFSQAKKSVCLRSLFDSLDVASVSTVPTLPSGLARLLSRQSHSRKRHKKFHSGADNKKFSRSSEKSKISNIWVETEEYFRDLTMSDLDSLSEVSLFSTSAGSKCFLIPVLGNAGCSEEFVKLSNENENFYKNENVNTSHANVDGEKKKEIVEEEVKVEDDEQSIEIDSVEDAEPSGGLEWLLASRNKICLTTELPSKKRKLLGGHTGLEKVLVASCDGNTSLCHFCSTDDSGKELNGLVSCCSCQVSVHRKCYGVHEDVDSSWLCSWCKKTIDSKDITKPCVFCPKQCGALKLAHRSVEKNEESMDFAHLFCSQWMPVVYVEDLEKMEPIMNIAAMKETRKNLVCSICKVRWGACVRCSHGSCRNSFHPLCVREASHRLEVWGKHGSDNVELRAFCSKHWKVLDKSITSQLANPSEVSGCNSDSMDHLFEKENVSNRNGENTAFQVEVPGIISDRRDGESQKLGLLYSGLNARFMSRCNDLQSPNDLGALECSSDDVNVSNSNFILILKKLVDHGRIHVEDVASEIGISAVSLSAWLADDTVVPDVQGKILKWLKDNVHLSNLHKNLKESDIAAPVAVKSIPTRCRTKGNIRILNDLKMLPSSQKIFSDKESIVDEVKIDAVISKEHEKLSEVSIRHMFEKNLSDSGGIQCSTLMSLNEGSSVELSNCNFQQSGQAEEVSISLNSSLNTDEIPSCSVADLAVPNLLKIEAETVSSFYMHPDICKKLLQMQNKTNVKTAVAFELNNGSKDEAPIKFSDCCIHPIKYPGCREMTCKSDEVTLEELILIRKMGILDLSPKDEVEGEIIYYQNRLLSSAVARERFTDTLKFNVSKSLPQEIDLASINRWDDVFATQYLYEVREAKKQGRKERRYKEAQAVLAAATAAAAASSRNSYFRKDVLEETTHLENMMKLNMSSGGSGGGSQLIPRAKESLQKVVAPRISLEKQTDFAQSLVDFSKELPRSCDICRRSETILNPILVCCSCKVAVHLDCYRSAKESTGPWYCELCEELSSSSRIFGASAVKFWEKPYFVAECGLCGGTTGAFRKSSNGQWVHAFCAEWVFDSRFKRGQLNLVEGMETVSKAVDLCLICGRKYGFCIKCNYGHCQATFHPSCARSAGFHMNIVKTSGGKQQHKAYCKKHRIEERAKAEAQRHGIGDLNCFKQVRVELERLRLLCDRIIKREKLKRDLVFISHEILAVKQDHLAQYLLVQQSHAFLQDVSSESITTSFKGHMDGYRSSSEAIQRSDDTTVDSTISVKYISKVSGTMDNRRTEDNCTTSHDHFTRKHTERPQFSGKQIPYRRVATNLVDAIWRSKLEKQETFDKELVMTSDQANVKNMRLPKGYAYVPADCLSNEKQINQNSCSGEPLEPGG